MRIVDTHREITEIRCKIASLFSCQAPIIKYFQLLTSLRLIVLKLLYRYRCGTLVILSKAGI